MSKQLDIFCEIPCLSDNTFSLKGSLLQKKWFKSADKRIIGQYLQKFIEYNNELLHFLGVYPTIVGTDQVATVSFRTTSFIGTIPLRAPDTGKQIGDFVVSPRFSGSDRFQDYIEILELLGSDISPVVINSKPLVSGNNFRPPFYLEAIKFIGSIEELINRPWRKFDNKEQICAEPIGQVNWRKYINKEFRVEDRIKFPVRKNILSNIHFEYEQLKFVFDLCKDNLLSNNVPQRIRFSFLSRIKYIEEKLYSVKPRITNQINYRSSDSPIVKVCKEQANKILNFHLTDSTAWRVDFSDVFEKYVQYIFKEVAYTTGARVISNFKFRSRSSPKYNWELKHIEPDVVYQKKDFHIFVDAKYKANLYNKYSSSDFLKDEFRHDLHQILAYSSFSKTSHKYCFLCYPSTSFESRQIKYYNELNGVTNSVFIVGMPIEKNSISEIKKQLFSIVTSIEMEYSNERSTIF